MSRRRAAIIAPLSPERTKLVVLQLVIMDTGNCRANALKNQRTTTTIVANDDNRRIEETGLKLHQET
jgi:hypothetical protein